MNYNFDDPIIAAIFQWLQGIKFLSGSKQIPVSLFKHPDIKKYLTQYLSDKAVDIENTISTLK